MKPSKYILPVIVISQFCCTSLWFAGNGVMHNLVEDFNLNENALGHLTSAVQLGFISGTLIFAMLSIADRYAPSKIFACCAFLAALFNLGITWDGNGITTILLFRFFTGFFLAGIYPVGMKIAADYYKDGLGKSLGYLVGALVLGTAFPHLLKNLGQSLPWKYVLLTTSTLAVLGGLMMAIWVPNGPYRKASQKIDLSAFFKVFHYGKFRSAAFGYFGHMWELYAFWAFVPVILHNYNNTHFDNSLNVSWYSFLIIGVGGLACVCSGYISQVIGTKKLASIALLSSCLCCLVSPFILSLDSIIILLTFLLFWGWVVIADSPLFSTLVAQNAPSEIKGTALTIVNSIGFAITIISIQLLNIIQGVTDTNYAYMILAIGPILGLWALWGEDSKA